MPDESQNAVVIVQAYTFFCPKCGSAVDIGYNIEGLVPAWAAQDAAGTTIICTCGQRVYIPVHQYLYLGVL